MQGLRSVGSEGAAPGGARTHAVPESPGAARLPLVKFVTRFDIGGTEKQVVELAKRFDGSDFDLRLACLKVGGSMDDKETLSRFRISEYPIRSLVGVGADVQRLRLARDLRRAGVRVLHSYNFYANVFSIPAARLAGVPCVVASIRDMGIYFTPMQERVQKWVCRLADAVVVNAEAIRRRLIEQGYAAEKIHVIRNGLDMRRARAGAAASIDSEFGIPPGARVVLMLSRLNPQKGVEYLLEAAPRVLRCQPDAWFVVVGDVVMSRTVPGLPQAGDYRRELEARARRLGIADRVVFTGVRTDVGAFLDRAEISVLPSLSEGLSNSILESMAAGLPVVATRVGGTPELIAHRHNGLLVPPQDASALADAICAVLGNRFLARRLGEQARRHVERDFSFERMYAETAQVYRRILAAKNRPDGPRGGDGRMNGAGRA